MGIGRRPALDLVDVVTRTPGQVRRQEFGVLSLLGGSEQPLEAAHGLDQQLQPTHIQHVRGNLRRIHALLTGMDLESRDLLIGDGHKRHLQQIDAVGLVVLTHPSPEVVQRAQLELAVAEIVVPDGIAYLKVVAELVVQLFIAPTEATLQRVQADQHVDGYVGPAVDGRVQDGEGVFLQPTEELSPKRPGPRSFQPLAQLRWQVVDIADQGRLQMTLILAEHASVLPTGHYHYSESAYRIPNSIVLSSVKIAS